MFCEIQATKHCVCKPPVSKPRALFACEFPRDCCFSLWILLSSLRLEASCFISSTKWIVPFPAMIQDDADISLQDALDATSSLVIRQMKAQYVGGYRQYAGDLVLGILTIEMSSYFLSCVARDRRHRTQRDTDGMFEERVCSIFCGNSNVVTEHSIKQ